MHFDSADLFEVLKRLAFKHRTKTAPPQPQMEREQEGAPPDANPTNILASTDCT